MWLTAPEASQQASNFQMTKTHPAFSIQKLKMMFKDAWIPIDCSCLHPSWTAHRGSGHGPNRFHDNSNEVKNLPHFIHLFQIRTSTKAQQSIQESVLVNGEHLKAPKHPSGPPTPHAQSHVDFDRHLNATWRGQAKSGLSAVFYYMTICTNINHMSLYTK